jgi:uncharacterized circularly permuted ATP-grasp superfamily protein
MKDPLASAAPATSLRNSIFSSFSCLPRHYCEAFGGPQARSHWQPIVAALDEMGSETLLQKQERVNRMRHEDGTTYNPFDDPLEKETIWDLDMIPVPLTADEWDGLERGLSQRALLLEQILADVYGPQNLVKNGNIPAELI